MATPHSRTAMIVGLAAAAVLCGSLAALAAGTGTIDPPPRIAFVARADDPADALSVGPTAGQLGAPVFVTAPTSLVPSTRAGLEAYDPDVVIIAGGPAAISADVEAAVEAALGLPDDKVVRAAGGDRFGTAVAIADLLAEHNPAYLPVDATAADADLLDGLDSSAFVRPLWAFVDAAGDLVRGVGVDNVLAEPVAAIYYVDFERDVADCAYVATAAGTDNLPYTRNVAVRGTNSTPNRVTVATADHNGMDATSGFMLVVVC